MREIHHRDVHGGRPGGIAAGFPEVGAGLDGAKVRAKDAVSLDHLDPRESGLPGFPAHLHGISLRYDPGRKIRMRESVGLLGWIVFIAAVGGFPDEFAIVSWLELQ